MIVKTSKYNGALVPNNEITLLIKLAKAHAAAISAPLIPIIHPCFFGLTCWDNMVKRKGKDMPKAIFVGNTNIQGALEKFKLTTNKSPKAKIATIQVQ